ncbi:BcsE family c-di-GMP-binding protein [uncultured Photobacterium sp.]|uniref:BcsE family c-di-GMP-binding protein n=1 Tax=uncultured Photobacterium sp. TaxID=173973 RepID=UPI00261AD6C1|nr:BcsE family c-di-GMP-binding protein [uncultured Photobacterium sp.]
MITYNTDSSSKAESINNDTLVVNMTTEEFITSFNANNHNLESMYNRIYFTTDSKHIITLREMAADLEIIKSNNNVNLHLLTEDRIFIGIEHTELVQFFVGLNQLLENTKTELSFFIYGQNIDSHIKPLMNSLCNYIKSLSTLYTNNINQVIHNIIFKHTKQGITTNKQHIILLPSTHNPTEPKKLHVNSKTPVPYIENDAEHILTTRDLLKDNEFLPPQYRALKNKSKLFKEAKSKKNALVIFPYQSHHDIDKISKLTFRLRMTLGNEMRIIVREVNCRMRYIDKIFLFESGVNLVIPSLLPFSELINFCYQVKRMTHQISCNISYNDLISRKPIFNTRGVFDTEQFTFHVKSLISYHINHHLDFALIKLKPLTDITTEQCLSLCQINRNGDLLTTYENRIYIFFSATRHNDIDQALYNIFKFKAELLFTQRTTISNSSDVNIELSKLKFNSTPAKNISPPPNIRERELYNKNINHRHAKRTPLERVQHKVSS